jgi:5'-nucleotidase
MDEPSILLTNDDGIESAGLRALYDVLTGVGDVTVVAPAEDQSAVGRSLSHDVTVREHDLGYAIEGTPADCSVAGLGSLAPDTDIVVAGCNQGANLGSYVLGRSGTVSAAVAGTAGERGNTLAMAVPRRIRSVSRATMPGWTNASLPHSSGIQTDP